MKKWKVNLQCSDSWTGLYLPRFLSITSGRECFVQVFRARRASLNSQPRNATVCKTDQYKERHNTMQYAASSELQYWSDSEVHDKRILPSYGTHLLREACGVRRHDDWYLRPMMGGRMGGCRAVIGVWMVNSLHLRRARYPIDGLAWKRIVETRSQWCGHAAQACHHSVHRK
jgi:hypothetical protein